VKPTGFQPFGRCASTVLPPTVFRFQGGSSSVGRNPAIVGAAKRDTIPPHQLLWLGRGDQSRLPSPPCAEQASQRERGAELGAVDQRQACLRRELDRLKPRVGKRRAAVQDLAFELGFPVPISTAAICANGAKSPDALCATLFRNGYNLGYNFGSHRTTDSPTGPRDLSDAPSPSHCNGRKRRQPACAALT
jgi:hypothetical protein